MDRTCYHTALQPYKYPSTSILRELNAGLALELVWRNKKYTDDCLVYLSEHENIERGM
jgi:hypothetical protein